MPTLFLYRRETCVTGRALARELGIPRNSYGMGEGRPTRKAVREGTTLIRWGTTTVLPGEREKTVNGASAISVSANKIRTFRALEEAGLPVPEWTRDHEVAGTWLREGSVVFSREPYGQGGRDIIVHHPNNGSHVSPASFYSRAVDVAREYRLHVVSGDVIRTQGRYLDHPEDSGDGLVRSHANGWRFRAPSLRLHGGRNLLAIEAVAAVGLDFGAVDLAVLDDGGAVIFEVNAAPGCSPLTLSTYAGSFYNHGWVT